jgi:galactokinase
MSKISSLIEKINNGNNAVFKKLYGNDTAVLKEQAERYASLMNVFKETYNNDNVELFSSPGRTEIGGNHTDHNYGRVLAGAVNLDNIAVAARNNLSVVRVKSIGYPEFQVDLSDLSPKKEEYYTSDALVKGIVARFKELGYEVGGFDVCNESRVPKGS